MPVSFDREWVHFKNTYQKLGYQAKVVFDL